jgi:hypothetical protein
MYLYDCHISTEALPEGASGTHICLYIRAPAHLILCSSERPKSPIPVVTMTLYMENEIPDYWNRQPAIPDHSISRYITRDRFQELYICSGAQNQELRVLTREFVILLLLIISY